MDTAVKVAVARLLASALVGVGLEPRRKARRRGIAYELDLREGIDLSLFLFGSFQAHVLALLERVVLPDGVVIDVGANLGSVTLPAAAHATRGRVYAVEPTDFAFARLLRNLSLNPDLATRVTPVQAFLADSESASSDLVAYSSWPVHGNPAGGAHPVHKGVAMPAACGQLTLDGLVRREGLQAVSFIKIDTDGHEHAVLSGAGRCLTELRPFVVFEACEYLMRPPRPTFEEFERLLAEHGYTISDSASLKPVDAATFRRRCPRGGSLDLAAIPDERLAGLRSG